MSKDSPFPDESLSIDPKEYLDYVRSLPCCACGGVAEPHHLKAVGAGRKRQLPKWEDYTGLSMCRGCHTEIELVGVRKFEFRYNIIIYKEGLHQLAKWIFHKSKIQKEDNEKENPD